MAFPLRAPVMNDLVAPQERGLSDIARWFAATPVKSSFTRPWWWNRATSAGDRLEGVWLWEEGRGISRFD